eukprot:746799-Hanusia_phi.AAC.1
MTGLDLDTRGRPGLVIRGGFGEGMETGGMFFGLGAVQSFKTIAGAGVREGEFVGSRMLTSRRIDMSPAGRREFGTVSPEVTLSAEQQNGVQVREEIEAKFDVELQERRDLLVNDLGNLNQPELPLMRIAEEDSFDVDLSTWPRVPLFSKLQHSAPGISFLRKQQKRRKASCHPQPHDQTVHTQLQTVNQTSPIRTFRPPDASQTGSNLESYAERAADSSQSPPVMHY